MGTFKKIGESLEKIGDEIEDATGAKTLPEKVGAVAGGLVGGVIGAAWNLSKSGVVLIAKGKEAASKEIAKFDEDAEEASLLLGKAGKEYSGVVTSVVTGIAAKYLTSALKKNKGKEENKGTSLQKKLGG